MKLRKGFIIFVIVIILGVGGFIYGRSKYIDSKELSVKIEKVITVNLGDNIYNIDAVKKIVNGKIVSKKEKVDTSKTGKQSIKLMIEDYFNKQKEYVFDLVVVDNIAPEITFKNKLSVEEDNKIDLLKDVSAKDNYDEEVEVKVEGDYDLKTPGTYKLYYVAKDSSGNETKEEFELVVTKKVVVEEKKEEKTNNNNNNTNTSSSTNNTQTKQDEVQNTEAPTSSDGSFTTSNGHSGVVKNGITYIDGVLIANKTYALPSNYNPGLSGTVTSKFNEMAAAAKSEKGFNLYIASGFRSYSTQKNLYNNYVKRDGKAAADTYSARAGHSEHQTGLAYDVCDRNVSACINSNFNSTDQAIWLKDNAYRWGFILRYPEGKSGETGYKWESWHFRYVGEELATKLYNGGNWITLESYFGITSQYNY